MKKIDKGDIICFFLKHSIIDFVLYVSDEQQGFYTTFTIKHKKHCIQQISLHLIPIESNPECLVLPYNT